MKRLTLTLLLFAWLAPSGAYAMVYTPQVYPECLDRDVLEDFEDAGAEDWELLAIRIITRDGTASRRGMTDIVATDCGAFGAFHLQPAHHVAGMTWEGECAREDPAWQWGLLSFLYSDHSASLQLTEWRDVVDVAVDAAADAGLDELEIAAVAAMANSTPSGTLRLGQRTGWNVSAMVDGYMAMRPSSRHRERRAAWIRRLCLGEEVETW